VKEHVEVKKVKAAHPAPYVEPSEQELKDHLVYRFAAREKFVESGIFVLNVSLVDYYKHFQADDSAFGHPKFWHHKKMRNVTTAKWDDEAPADFTTTFEGCPNTLKYRKQNGIADVKGIPMVSEADVTKHYMIYEQSDLHLRLKCITRTAKVPNGDKAQTEEAWDIVTKDPRSRFVAVRHSLFVHFFSRPYLIANKMETSMKTK